MSDEVSSISSQIAEQIEVISEVVSSKLSKLIDSVMSKRQGDQENSFLEKKGHHKIENAFTIKKHAETSYQLMDRVMK